MASFISKYRWLVIFFCVMLGAGSLMLIPSIKADPEIRNYVPASMSSRVETDKIENEFGVQDMVMIMFADSCIVSTDNLKYIRDIDRAVSQLEGVSHHISPFTIRSIRGEEGMMVAEPLIAGIPDDDTALSLLRESILENKFARDIVVSSDLTTASITATISNSEDESLTLGRIDSVLNATPGKPEIIKGGLPYIRQNILNDVSRDALVLVPVALMIMLLILKTSLGSWRYVLLPFSVVMLSTAFSMALIPLLGWNISIMTLLVPVILIAVANNYGIYLVAMYQELAARNLKMPVHELLKLLMKSLKIPILFSGLTTVAGILGLLLHSIIPARQVGILAAAGVTLALSLSLLLIPALIIIASYGAALNNRLRASKRTFDTFLAALSRIIVKYPGRVLMISAFVIASVSSGVIFLKINTNQENYFPKKHPVRQASEIINSKFGGSQTVSVMVAGDIKNPQVMKGIDELTAGLEQVNGVGSVFSISQAIREMSKAIFTSAEDGYDKIPVSGDAIAQMFELYYMSGDQEDFKQLINPENTRAHILVRLSEPERSVIDEVKTRINILADSIPAEVTVGGYALIMDDFAGSIIKGQIASLLFAVVAVLLLLTMIFRSVKGGLIGSIPFVASVLILFGFMGFTGIALDAATALLSSVMIGVGVDFTIQYMWCFNSQLRNGLSYPDATVASIKTIGRSIIINAFTVMAGFSALILSGFTSIRFFGYLVLISIGSCLAGAIVIIPAILVRFRPRLISYETNVKKQTKNEKTSDLINSTSAAFSGSWTTA